MTKVPRLFVDTKILGGDESDDAYAGVAGDDLVAGDDRDTGVDLRSDGDDLAADGGDLWTVGGLAAVTEDEEEERGRRGWRS